MNRDETLALFAQGREAWNAWADGMLEKRRALEDAGNWDGEASRRWAEDAKVDFSEYTFERVVRFAEWIFPSRVNFAIATFNRTAEFGTATFRDFVDFGRATFNNDAMFWASTFNGFTNFERATFKSFASFEISTFNHPVNFSNATFNLRIVFTDTTFSSTAEFWNTKFRLDPDFKRATFAEFADFGSATFGNPAVFQRVRFNGNAGFGLSTFRGNADFARATFTGDAEFWDSKFNGLAVFAYSVFNGSATFDRSSFTKSADFKAIRCESAYSLASAEFLRVPDFNQAHFDEAPRLDNIRIEPWRIQSGIVFAIWSFVRHPCRALRLRRRIAKRVLKDFAWCRRLFNSFLLPDPDHPSRWRSLKRLAIQAHDHARELEYFAREVKARRFCEDKWWHATFWAGLFYQGLSGFGRSILRPLFWLAAAIVIFGIVYLDAYQPPANATVTGTEWAVARTQAALGLSVAPAPLLCNANTAGKPWLAALHLSIGKSLPLPGIGSGDKINQVHACLYGVYSERPFRPVIPDRVALFGYVQIVVSTILLFLLLLALRNHFRIR